MLKMIFPSLYSEDATFDVKIPAGIDNEQTIRLNGEGNQTASANGIPGDLRINIFVKEHPLLVRKGFDLFVDVYAPITTLMLGGKVEVPTLKGPQYIDVAPLTQSNTKYTLKGKGIKYLKSFGSGDIIVTFGLINLSNFLHWLHNPQLPPASHNTKLAIYKAASIFNVPLSPWNK